LVNNADFRVWVASVIGSSAEVKFVDFGNTEVKQFKELRQLPCDFWQWKPQAMPFRVRTFSPGCPGMFTPYLPRYYNILFICLPPGIISSQIAAVVGRQVNYIGLKYYLMADLC